MLNRRLAIGLILAVMAFGTGTATAGSNWLHIRVDGDEGGERVRINLPLDLVVEVLPLIEVDELRQGKLEINSRELDDFLAIRKVHQALRNAEDGEYLEVEDTHDRVTVSKQGDEILVHVEEGYYRDADDEDAPRRHRHSDTTVDIRVPLAVVDALFSGEEDELDLIAAVEALRKEGPGTMVTVNEDDTKVEIWVDDKSSQD